VLVLWLIVCSDVLVCGRQQSRAVTHKCWNRCRWIITWSDVWQQQQVDSVTAVSENSLI